MRDRLSLLVTGCMHSGTRFMAHVLDRAGLPTGHERIFTLRGISELAADSFAGSGPIGDVSWCATAHLGTGEIPASAAIVHQVRDPMAWLNSWVRTSGALDAWTLIDSMWPRMAARFDRFDTERVITAMRLWVLMNERCERATAIRYRIEDVDQRTVLELGVLAGIAFDRRQVATALVVSADDAWAQNSHPAGHARWSPIAWRDLPPGPDLDAFASMARRYGYHPDA